MIHQALIPAAGRGARLDRPGTPKPLVDVGGQPMIFRLIKQLKRSGINRIVVVVGYEGKIIARAINQHSGFNADIQIVKNPNWEQGLAGSILTAKDLFSEPFVLAMADHVFDEELISLIAATPFSSLFITALVDSNCDKIFDINSSVKLRLNQSIIEDIGFDLKDYNAVDAGLFAATPNIFESLKTVFEKDTNSDLCDAIKIMAEQNKTGVIKVGEKSWDDVDTPAGLIHAEMRFRRQKRTKKISKPIKAKLVKSIKPYKFVVGKPENIDIVVGRDFVKEPSTLALIPDEAASSPVFVFTDETVYNLYGERFIGELRNQGYNVHSMVLPDGEESKSIANYVYLVERVLSRGVDERSVFISLGGGVVCNVCGFVASTIYRGLDLVHLPTTLMAQCDAAISHKQAINSSRGKNMVGSYFKPRLVAVDVKVLSTLPDRLKGDGLAEVIKHAVGQDPSYVEMLLAHAADWNNIDFFEKSIRRNVALKCELAAHDPKELHEAMILQYGHTVGHAVEHLTGYNLYHGESVAIGMMVAARISRLLGGCGDDLVDLHERLCANFNLPTRIPENLRVQDIIDSLKYNKKHLTEGTRMALLCDVGKLWSVDNNYAIPVSDKVLVEACELSMEDK